MPDFKLPITVNGVAVVLQSDPRLTTQPVNVVFAGPGSGGSAAPAFRALVTADLPAITFASLASKPTTLVGYGITDAAALVHTHAWADITTGKPTTLAGYGITDAVLKTGDAMTGALSVTATLTDAASTAAVLLTDATFEQTATNAFTYRGASVTARGTTTTNASNALEGMNVVSTFRATGGGTKLSILRGIATTINTDVASTGDVSNIQGVSVTAMHQGSGTGGNVIALVTNTSIESGGGTASALRGQQNVVRHKAANTLPTVEAFYGQFQTNAGAGCVITTARTFRAVAPVFAAGSAVGISIGLDIEDHGDPLVTTSYGLRIYAQTGSATAYAIYSLGGQSYHAGNLGLGVTAPTAVLHLKAGTASASSAPLKFNAGTLLGAPENGTIEYTAAGFFYTHGGVQTAFGSTATSVPWSGITGKPTTAAGWLTDVVLKTGDAMTGALTITAAIHPVLAINTTQLVVDGVQGMVGVNRLTPAATLHVNQETIAAVGSGNGTAGTTVLNIASTAGGATNDMTTASGGASGAVSISLGAGGRADSAAVASTGGAGGAFSIASGPGGGALVAGAGVNTGGTGGVTSVTAGAGGAATGATTGANNAGNGGNTTLTTGSGGAANSGLGANAAGDGGTLTAQGGVGGTATGNIGTTPLATWAAGIGGAVNVLGGAGGPITVTNTALQTGGAGGAFAARSGSGAAASNSSVENVGGAGGQSTLSSGGGGAANVATAGINRGGASGALFVQAGAGGAAANGTGGNFGGAGGTLTLRGGTGGTGATAAGAGGEILFQTAITSSLVTAMRIDNQQRVAVGANAPVTSFEINTNSALGSILTLRRFDTGIAANDPIGTIQFYAADADTVTNFVVANIEAQATNAISTDINPGRLIFRTTPVTVAATPVERLRIDQAGDVTLFDTSSGGSLILGTTTGTKIGTAVTQKVAFYGSTPIVQRVGAAQVAAATTAATQTTPWGFTTQAQANAIVTLVNELRAALVALGLIKGAA